VQGTLKRKRQFQRAYHQGTKAVGHHMVAFALSDAGTPDVLVGVVASRKVGKAHRRNLAKRRLREAFRAWRDELAPDTWIVLVARAPLAEPRVAPDRIREEMRRLFLRMGILESKPPHPSAEPPA